MLGEGEREGGRDRVPPQDSGRGADRQMGKEACGSREGVRKESIG